MTKDDIINAIDEHLTKSERKFYSDFYVGITDNIEERLFGYHNVNKVTDWWIHCYADSEQIAREIEKHYLELGMDGGTGGGSGDGNTRYVYCYEKNDHTRR